MAKCDNSDLYLDAYSSTVKYIQNLIEDMRIEGFSENVEFRNIDGHAEDAVLENIDYIFIKDFSGDVGYSFNYWTFLIGVSTFEDEGMFRHRRILNYLLKNLLPMMKINLYDNKTLQKKKGILIIEDPVTVVPFSKYNTRAVQFISAGVSSTETTHAFPLQDRI